VEAERRRTQGVVGDWQTVEPTATEPPSATGEESTQHVDDMQSTEDNKGTSSNKRAVPVPAEEEGRWKLRKKMTTVGLGEIYDPGVIMIKPKVKAEEETAGQEKQPYGGTAMPEDNKATTIPKWAPVKWKKAGESVDDTSGATGSGPGGVAVRTGGLLARADPLNADEDPAPASVIGTPTKEEPLPIKLEDPAPASVTDNSVKEEPSSVKLEQATTPSVETASSGGSLFRKRKTPLGGGASSRGRRY